MNIETIIAFIRNHKGKILGVVLGFLFGAFVLHIGLWYSIFLAICIAIGLYIGRMHDRGERLAAFFDKIMNKRIKL